MKLTLDKGFEKQNLYTNKLISILNQFIKFNIDTDGLNQEI